MRETVERWLGTLFGLIFVALSLVVALETAVRKLFNFSLQGADELGGYALAVGATIAFSMALLARTHVRVDVFHARPPPRVQTFLNWLSSVSMAAFGGLMAWLAWFVIQDSQSYKSVSQTPWATPLVIPQSAWLVGLIIFGALATGVAVYATFLLATGRTSEVNALLNPRSSDEELEEELEDLKVRAKNNPSTTVPRGAA